MEASWRAVVGREEKGNADSRVKVFAADLDFAAHRSHFRSLASSKPPSEHCQVIRKQAHLSATPAMPLPTIWGFDLREMSWSALSSRRMFNRRWHLRRERFGESVPDIREARLRQTASVVVYQLAMLTCLAAECTATYSLAKYSQLQDNIGKHFPPAQLYQNDLVDVAIVTIVFCVLVAAILGADRFVLLFFPRRTYPRWYDWSRKGLTVLVLAGVFVAGVCSTVRLCSQEGARGES